MCARKRKEVIRDTMGVGLLDGLVKVANSKGQTDRLARILWLRGH